MKWMAYVNDCFVTFVKRKQSKKIGNQQVYVLPQKIKSNISLIQRKRTSVPSIHVVLQVLFYHSFTREQDFKTSSFFFIFISRGYRIVYTYLKHILTIQLL